MPSAKLLIVGDGPLREQIAQQIQKANLGAHVLMLGSRPDIPHILAAMDVFALTSTTEGMPMTILEAMASSVPVVATKVGGIPSVIRDRETGIVIAPRAPEELARAILFLFGNAQAAKAMSCAGCEDVERHYDIRMTLSRYEDVYARRAQGKRAAYSVS